MNDKIKEISTLAKWCKHTRSILGTGIGLSGESVTMQKQISSVKTMLKNLSRQTGESDEKIFEAAMEQFRELAKEHQRLDEAYQKAVTEKEKTKRKSTERQEAEVRVKKAREDVQGLIGKMATLQQDLISDFPLARAVHFFELAVRDAEIRIQNERQSEHADTVALGGALDNLTQWKNEVATDDRYRDPVAVEKLTGKIKSLVDDLVKGAVEGSGQQRKVDERQSRHRGPAEQRLQQVELLLKELTETGRLTPAIGKQLESGIKAAKTLFDDGQWVEGEKELRSMPRRKACLKAFDAARVEAGVDFKDDIEHANLALKGLKEEVDPATYNRYLSAHRLLQGRAGAPERKVKDMQTLLEDFRNHLEAMKTELRNAVEAQGRLEQSSTELRDKAESLTDIVPPHRTEENRRQIQLVELLVKERQWKEAEDTAKLLKTSMEQQDSKDYGRWQQRGAELGTRGILLKDLRMAIGTPGATPALQDMAQQMLDAVAPDRLQHLQDERDWSALMALHTQADQFVKNLAAQIEQYADFAGAREDIDGTVQVRLKRCASSLSELKTALARAGADDGPVLAPIERRFEELQAGWKRCMDSASEPSNLFGEQMLQELNLLQQSILSANYGPNLDETVGQQRDDAGRGQFDEAVAKLELEGLGPLEQVDASQAGEFRREIVTLSRDVSREDDQADPWAQRVLGVAAVASRVTTAREGAGKACEQLNRELTGQADAVALVLSSAVKEIEGKGLLHLVARRYRPMIEAMQNELAGLRELLATTNTTAAAGNRLLLADLKKRADQLVQLAKHNKEVDGREQRANKLEEDLKALRNDGLAKWTAETDGVLGQQLADIKRDMYGMEPDVMHQALDAFADALVAARTALQGLLDRKTSVQQLAGNLGPRVKTLSASGLAGDYYATLQKRIDKAVEQSAGPAQLEEALLAIRAVQTEVGEAESDPNKALARLKLQNTEEHGQSRMKNEYEGRLKVLEKTVLARAKKAVSDASGDQGQLTELDRMVERAKKMAGKKQYEQALLALRQVENRIAQIEKNPAGTALGDRNALPKHIATFAGHVRGLRDQLDAFVTAAETKAPEEARATVRESLEKTVLKIKTQLNPNLLDLYTPTIVDNKADKAKRRTVRDQALQRVREAQAFISSQPNVVKLANNPILPLLEPLRMVDASLTRLDAHLRAAIR